MFGTIASGLVFTEVKGILFPRFTSQLRSFWEQWEIRSLILVSQALQIILVSCGDRRKFTGKSTPWIAILVWSTYLMANWVAAIALSSLLKSNGEVCTRLVVLWVPFLLLHLGGPDSITAYSLEDNDLWLRHLFTFSIQVLVSLYVYWKFRANNAISLIAILIFVAGIIKYGERIWVLKHSSSKRMKQHFFQSAEPEHDEASMSTRKEERVDVDAYISRVGIIPEARYLHESFLMFQVFRPMFSDLTLRIYKVLLNDVKVFTTALKSPEEAFKLVDVELGFLYDMFYTKRALLNTPCGAILRGISCLSLFIALVTFILVMGFGRDEESVADMCISYSLLVVAVGLEVNSVIVHCLSNWVIMRVTRETSWITGLLRKIVVAWLSSYKDGFKSMAQFNLIDFCLVSRASPTGAIEKVLDTDFILRKYCHTKWIRVNFDLKNLIYSHLTGKCTKYEEQDYKRIVLQEILEKRGDDALKQAGIIYDDFKWSITEVEFNYSLILWHIATGICYNDDCSKYGVDILGKHCQFSKDLSDYMLYLQVIRPSMLPKGIGEVRFRDTCDEVRRFIQNTKEFDSCEVSKALLYDNPERPVIRIPGKTKAVMLEASKLAVQLQDLVVHDRWDVEEKWRLICQVWVEMLTYAAGQCSWKEHIQELQRGRELLSYVSLLMAHMGLTDKVQIIELPQDLQMIDYQPPWKWDTLRHLAYYLA